MWLVYLSVLFVSRCVHFSLLVVCCVGDRVCLVHTLYAAGTYINFLISKYLAIFRALMGVFFADATGNFFELIYFGQ